LCRKLDENRESIEEINHVTAKHRSLAIGVKIVKKTAVNEISAMKSWRQ